MSTLRFQVQTDYASLQHFLTRTTEEAVWKAAVKAGNDTLRNVRTESNRQVRAERRLKARRVRDALRVFPARGKDRLRWRMGVSGAAVPLYAYGARKTTKRGVSVNVSGRRQIVEGAFIATMGSGHTGVFKRRGTNRLPIDELFSTRVSDVFQNTGFADQVHRFGVERFGDHWRRLVDVEIDRERRRALRRARSRR